MPDTIPHHLYVTLTLLSGTRNAHPLPPAPEGRALARVWTVRDPDSLREMGPLHKVNAFLEDATHDFRVKKNCLHYYSRLKGEDDTSEVLLDYETDAERQIRLLAMVRANDARHAKVKP